MDQDGRQDGADGETCHGEALDEPEDAGQDIIRHDALEQGPAGDVDESKAYAADHHHARGRESPTGPTGAASRPRPKTAAPERQPRRESAPTNQDEGQRATDHAAEPDGSRQVAGPGASDLEDLDGQQHEQDVDGTDHDVAGAEHDRPAAAGRHRG